MSERKKFLIKKEITLFFSKFKIRQQKEIAEDKFGLLNEKAQVMYIFILRPITK